MSVFASLQLAGLLFQIKEYFDDKLNEKERRNERKTERLIELDQTEASIKTKNQPKTHIPYIHYPEDISFSRSYGLTANSLDVVDEQYKGIKLDI